MNDLAKYNKVEPAFIVKALNSLIGIISGVVDDGELNNLRRQKSVKAQKYFCEASRSTPFSCDLVVRCLNLMSSEKMLSFQQKLSAVWQ